MARVRWAWALRASVVKVPPQEIGPV
jgi:hypothetical protein